MKNATIYTARFCPYCDAAKSLLRREGIEFTEKDISGDWETRDEMITRSNGQTTVPQIFLDDRHVGNLASLRAVLGTGSVSKQQ